MVRHYKHPLLFGKPCMIHEEFVPSMDYFCECLHLTGCKAHITSSQRFDTNVAGAIVEPARMGNHLVAHAIDCNIYDKANRLWNSTMLLTPSGEVLDFITLVKKKLRWGGDFKKRDSVHFDNALNLRNPIRWKEIFNELKPQTS